MSSRITPPGQNDDSGFHEQVTPLPREDSAAIPVPFEPASGALSHERLVAMDVLFPQLGEALVTTLTNEMPTERMTQDDLHDVLFHCVARFQEIRRELNPNASDPETLYEDGAIESQLENAGLSPQESTRIASRLEMLLTGAVMDIQQRLATQYRQEILPSAAYDRLKQRELYKALSTTPREDADQLADALGLNTSEALRFSKAYQAYVQERNKMHVGSAALMAVANHAKPGSSAKYSDMVAGANEKADALLDAMASIVAFSEIHAMPGDVSIQQHNTKQILVRALHSSQGPISEPPTGAVKLNEPSDYRFTVSARNQMHNPALRARFDEEVQGLQAIADEMLNPDKTSTFNALPMAKHAKNLEKVLAEAEVSDHKAVAARIVNIFTKQVDLVQSRSNSGKT